MYSVYKEDYRGAAAPKNMSWWIITENTNIFQVNIFEEKNIYFENKENEFGLYTLKTLTQWGIRGGMLNKRTIFCHAKQS